MGMVQQTVSFLREWAATVAAGLCAAMVIGGLSLHSDVQVLANELSSTMVLAQATANTVSNQRESYAAIREEVSGLRRDIDKIAKKLDDVATDNAKDRALILQELGRLQGRQGHGGSK